MKKATNLIITLVLLILLFSCKKDQDFTPKTYVYQDYTIGQIKLITNTGPITDTSIINNFLHRIPYFKWFSEPSDFEKGLEIELITNTSGRMKNYLGDYFDLNITRKNGMLYLEGTDTLVDSYSSIFIKNERFKYFPLYYKEYPNGDFSHVECTYVIEEGDIIYMPILYYYEKFKVPYMTTMENANNEFDEKYLFEIQSDTIVDTIAYQDSRIIYKLK